MAMVFKQLVRASSKSSPIAHKSHSLAPKTLSIKTQDPSKLASSENQADEPGKSAAKLLTFDLGQIAIAPKRQETLGEINRQKQDLKGENIDKKDQSGHQLANISVYPFHPLPSVQLQSRFKINKSIQNPTDIFSPYPQYLSTTTNNPAQSIIQRRTVTQIVPDTEKPTATNLDDSMALEEKTGDSGSTDTEMKDAKPPESTEITSMETEATEEKKTPSQNVKIAKIKIGGRPDEVFKDSAGDHTTAFAVHVKGLQLKLVGKNYEEAFGEINGLIDQVKELPGAKLVNTLPEHHKEELSQEQTRLNTLKDQINEIITGKDTKTNNQLKLALKLQDYVDTYLSWRELIPLSVIKTKEVTAKFGKGHGESKPSKFLFDYEQGKGESKEYTPKQAIIDLLDQEALALVAGEPNDFNLPTIAPGLPASLNWDERITWMVRQHIESIKMYFPKAFKAAWGDDEQGIKALQESVKEPLIEYLKKALGGLTKTRKETIERIYKSYQDLAGDTGLTQKDKGTSATTLEEAQGDLETSGRQFDRLAFALKGLGGEPPEKPTVDEKQVEVLLGGSRTQGTRGSRSKRERQPPTTTYSAPPTTSKKRPQNAEEKPKSKHLKTEKGLKGEKESDETTTVTSPATESEKPKSQQEEEKSSLAIQIILKEDNTIKDIRSEGRSGSPFTNTMGAHTTAWVVHLDRIRAAIQNKTIDEAISELNKVFEEEKGHKDELSQVISMRERQSKKLDDTENLVNALKGKIATMDEATKPLMLQEYIRLLLSFINYIPGSTLESGSNNDNKKEQKHRKTLLNHEANKNETEQDLKKAIEGLLDLQAVDNDKAKKLIRYRHLCTIEKAYPISYQDSKLKATKDILKLEVDPNTRFSFV